MKSISLKNKIIVTVIGAIIIAGSVATYSVFLYSKNIFIEKEKELISVTVTQAAHEVAHSLSQYENLSKSFSEDMAIIEALENGENIHEKIGPHLHHYSAGKEGLFLFIANKSGEVVASTNPGLINKNINTKGYFKHAISGDEHPCFAVAVNDDNGNLDYYVTSSIKKEDGEVIGAAVVQVGRGIFDEAVVPAASSGEELKMMIVNKHGVIVNASKREIITKSLGYITDEVKETINEKNHFPGINIEPIQYEEAQRIIDSGSDNIEFLEFYDKEDGETEMMVISKTGDYPFFVIIETEKEIHIEDAIRIAYVLSILVGLAACSAGILIYFSINYQLSPLDTLHDFVMRAAKGNYAIQMNKVEGSREIADLANAFNMLIRNVKKSREEIDNKVKEQTKDIDDKRKELESQKAAILNILEDVSLEKEKTEALAKDLEKFQLAVENASDHIVITDPDGVVLYANKAVEKITGFKNKEVVGEKAGSDKLWGGLMDEKIYKEFWDVIKNKKEVFAGEFKNKRKNGDEYDAAASVGPVLNKNGEVLFFIGIERDITKEKEIDKAKTEFVSLASHQLRTPLSAINWYTEMLIAGDAGKITKTQRSYLEEVYNGSNRMVALVNALLNVSRIDLGTFAVEPEEIDLKNISNEIIKELSPKIKKKKMKIVKKYDPKLKKINADPKLVGIIFQNLISNAVKYTPDKGKISVEIKMKKPNVLINISDNGFGIPEGQQSKIFEKLFRADNVREKETDGTGLGLYIVKSIVEQSGGRIWFESKEDKGTKFYVELPLSGMKKKKGNKELSAV